LPDHLFPAPTVDTIDEYLGWDDWRVLGLISDERAGEHGKRLIGRNHYREVYHTTEQPSLEEDDELQKVRADIKEDLKLEKPAGKSWYKVGAADEILVLSENPGFMVKPLSQHSRVAAEIKSSNQTRLYVEPNRASEVRERIKSILKIQEGVPDE
jgi:hypothetical protein